MTGPLSNFARPSLIIGRPVPIFDRHLKRLLLQYVRYDAQDRTRRRLAQATPAGRNAEVNPNSDCRVISMPRPGELLGNNSLYCLFGCGKPINVDDDRRDRDRCRHGADLNFSYLDLGRLAGVVHGVKAGTS